MIPIASVLANNLDYLGVDGSNNSSIQFAPIDVIFGTAKVMVANFSQNAIRASLVYFLIIGFDEGVAIQ